VSDQPASSDTFEELVDQAVRLEDRLERARREEVLRRLGRDALEAHVLALEVDEFFLAKEPAG
jgi:hypothetical protein